MAPAQLKTYGRIMESRLKREDGRKEVERFASSLVMDCRIGMEANILPGDCEVDVLFYHSPADEVWPSRVEGMYEDLATQWEPFTRGRYRSEEVSAVSHNELGGVQSPLLSAICRDLSALVQ